MHATSEPRSCTAAKRSLDTLRYFFEAALEDARMVLRTAQAIVRDRENGNGTEPPSRQATEPGQSSGGTAPLTETDVRDIRRRYQPGEACSALAHEYARTVKTIQAIACRQTWKHLPPEPGEYRYRNPAQTTTTVTPSITAHATSRTETTPAPAAPKAPRTDETAAGTTNPPRTRTAPPQEKTTPTPGPGSHQKNKKNTARKLTKTQVHEIRRAYRPGVKTLALAKRYGISTANVLLIVNRRSWKHLEPEPGEYVPPTTSATQSAPAQTDPPAPARTHEAATPAAKAKPTTAAKPNGARRDAGHAAPDNQAAARIHAEKQRLTPDSIRSIRELAADNIPPRRIARDFGISEETVLSLTG